MRVLNCFTYVGNYSNLNWKSLMEKCNIGKMLPQTITVELLQLQYTRLQYTLTATFVGPTWGPAGADRTQVGSMLAPWTLLSLYVYVFVSVNFVPRLHICPSIKWIIYQPLNKICSMKSTILYHSRHVFHRFQKTLHRWHSMMKERWNKDLLMIRMKELQVIKHPNKCYCAKMASESYRCVMISFSWLN